MKLVLLLRWAERRNRGGPKGKEERERSGFWGFLFFFKTFFFLNHFQTKKFSKFFSKLFKSF
jgi:hypothetical protein